MAFLNGPSGGDESRFIRLGSPEPAAQMEPLDIYSSTTAFAASVQFNYCHFLLRGGPDGLSADILRRGRHPLSAALYLFEEAIVPGFFGNCERILDQLSGAEIGFKVKNHKAGLF